MHKIEQRERGWLKTNPWAKYLLLTKEHPVNMEYVEALETIPKNPVWNYTKKTLEILADEPDIPKDIKSLIEETLVWSEVAKCGSPSVRKKWASAGVNVYVHNIGSAQIYKKESTKSPEHTELITTLISTHGLIGQYIRGESLLSKNQALYPVLKCWSGSNNNQSIQLLMLLNKCIIAAVSPILWETIEREVHETVTAIVNGYFDHEASWKERLRKLRHQSIQNGENFDREFERIFSDIRLQREMEALFNSRDLWFVEAALKDFTLEEFTKIFLLISRKGTLDYVKHINFSELMKEMYYDHQGKKKVNLYKKRIFEKYLSECTFKDLLAGEIKDNPHVSVRVDQKGQTKDTVFFYFVFSPPSQKLIEFCMESEKYGTMFEKAILLLYDFFELRRDQFDRFHNEDEYLETMNQTIELKRVILDYIIGTDIADIGPGGGALLDEIVKRYPNANAFGIDFSKNVVESLEKRIQKENLSWKIQFGNALDLEQDLAQPVDTIIFCSILHELYSYIETDGNKFNLRTIQKALQSAFRMLRKGGRIIIRDGIMSEPKETYRIIRFRDSNDLKILYRYSKDFEGRAISYEVAGHNEVKMQINDCMEFLYTYTWGEDAYPHEVQEQFGYLTPSEYETLIRETLGEEAEILINQHYLQEGYAHALETKIEFLNEDYRPVPLPDSTCLIVIQKNS